MRRTLKWAQKYELCLKETLSIKEIMELRDCGQTTATKIRDNAIEYCVINDIEFSTRKVPTMAIFQVTKLDIGYYYEKMIQESKIIEYKGV